MLVNSWRCTKLFADVGLKGIVALATFSKPVVVSTPFFVVALMLEGAVG